MKSFDPSKGKVGLIKTKSKKFHTCKCVLLSKSFVCQVCCIGVLYNLDSSTRSFKLCLFPAAPRPPKICVSSCVPLCCSFFLSFFLLTPMACSQLMVLKEYWTTEPDKHKNQCCCQDLSLYLHI